ncbi:hypothetical protein EVAR_12061_1 [Eumeta japonica]|uniref:Uncharacterized protein n=1 Tax=Eumeta variegata TaxID=151549 RepID=A0A4C1U5C7_EUMVA|nr:hypothetical protein EVAR_12061_1 [Eumeta japonica]
MLPSHRASCCVNGSPAFTKAGRTKAFKRVPTYAARGGSLFSNMKFYTQIIHRQNPICPSIKSRPRFQCTHVSGRQLTYVKHKLYISLRVGCMTALRASSAL